MDLSPEEFPHRRFNPLLGEYVLVSPHRMRRPWQGQVEKLPPADLPVYDPKCYLCPGNTRTSGAVNPQYESTFVFTNDFAALLPESLDVENSHDLLRTEPVAGTSKVFCFAPDHDKTLAELPVEQIRAVVDLWMDVAADLGKTYRWVQLFENRGAMMGSSNPHPHGQVWAMDALPNEVRAEDTHQRAYFEANGFPMLVEYAGLESELGVRVVVENEEWVVVVPFWAVWPYEVMVLPKTHTLRITDLSRQQQDSLAEVVKGLLVKYDNLFETSFPYSMGWHGAPFDENDNSHWQLHAHFYPPLLRSATVRKFMVGFELLGEAQRDITAEVSAEQLRKLSDIHYKVS